MVFFEKKNDIVILTKLRNEKMRNSYAKLTVWHGNSYNSKAEISRPF
jgi:hypothetical protein